MGKGTIGNVTARHDDPQKIYANRIKKKQCDGLPVYAGVQEGVLRVNCINGKLVFGVKNGGESPGAGSRRKKGHFKVGERARMERVCSQR